MADDCTLSRTHYVRTGPIYVCIYHALATGVSYSAGSSYYYLMNLNHKGFMCLCLCVWWGGGGGGGRGLDIYINEETSDNHPPSIRMPHPPAVSGPSPRARWVDEDNH